MTGAQAPTWEELARDHGALVYGYARRLTGDPHDASDLAQEVLIKAGGALERFDPASLRGWLWRITRNAFLDALRRGRRRPTVALAEGFEDRWADAGPTPEEALERAELGAALAEALASLPAHLSQAVVLRDLGGLSYAEVAGVLGVPVGTVRSRLHRGRRALRNRLG